MTLGTFIVDDEALDCALDQLIAGEPGFIHWQFTTDGGYSGLGGFVGLTPERRGLARGYSWVDWGDHPGPAGVVPVRAATYFQSCKDEPDLAAKFWCMTRWSEGAPTLLCE